MVKSWSLPIAGTCDAEASVPRTDWEVLPLKLDQLNHLQPIHESQPYPRHIQVERLACFDADNRTLSGDYQKTSEEIVQSNSIMMS